MMNLERHEEVTRYKTYRDSFKGLTDFKMNAAIGYLYSRYNPIGRGIVLTLKNATVIHLNHNTQYVGKSKVYIQRLVNFGNNNVFACDSARIQADEIEGKYFKYFINTITGEVLSYNKVTEFEVFGNMNVEAVYSDIPSYQVNKDAFSSLGFQFFWNTYAQSFMLSCGYLIELLDNAEYEIKFLCSRSKDVEPTLENVSDDKTVIVRDVNAPHFEMKLGNTNVEDYQYYAFRFAAIIKRDGKDEILYSNIQEIKQFDI